MLAACRQKRGGQVTPARHASVPAAPLEIGLEPGLVRHRVLHLGDVVERALAVPRAGIPVADTPPEVAGVVARVAGDRRRVAEPWYPPLVARAHDAVHVLGAEGRVVAAHRPG